MVRKVFLITDYKGQFGSKYNDSPYRSGFDKVLLSKLFHEKGIDTEFLKPQRAILLKKLPEYSFVLYTSQEDRGLFYKTYLEDYVYALELANIKVVPSYSLLKAHENKVFFEMLRKCTDSIIINNIQSFFFGTLEEFNSGKDEIKYPVVIKTYNGSMSRGIFLARSKREAERFARKITSTKNVYLRFWDLIRFLKHKGYIKESWNRKKFIIQEYIPGLKNDYKVLIYGRKYYVLRRENKKNDFRASGQGELSFQRDLPEGLLDFSEKCFNLFKSPQASFDIGFNGKDFFLFEAQFIYFGTYTIENSDFYFKKDNDNWNCVEGKSILEKEYVNSVLEFLEA